MLKRKNRSAPHPQPLSAAAEAPANLALIKYMGKQAQNAAPPTGPQSKLWESLPNRPSRPRNQPLNSSLSLTLERLKVRVELLPLPTASKDAWGPLIAALPPAGDESVQFFTGNQPAPRRRTPPSPLSLKEQKRFLDFFCFLKEALHIKGFYLVRSGGNFPRSIGAASSSAAFAALAQAAASLSASASPRPLKLSPEELAWLSAFGSGSSARSFFSPAAIWRPRGAQALNIPFKGLLHEVWITEEGMKKTPSSEAHQRVLTSPLFKGRPQRAEQRLQQLLKALQEQDWPGCFHIAWEEFQDMRSLFETSSPPFSYKSKRAEIALLALQRFWRKHKDGPLVTMDAGPSIHLIYRADQKNLKKRLRNELLKTLCGGD